MQATQLSNYADYLPLALRTEKPLPTMAARLSHAALGLTTEAGEIVTQVKRIVIYSKSLDDLDEKQQPVRSLREHIGEEIGDVFWYIAIAVATLNLDLFSHFARIEPLHREGVTPDQRLERIALSLSSNVGAFNDRVYQVARWPHLFSREAHDAMNLDLQFIGQNLVDLADVTGLSLLDLMGENIDKLRARYPNTYSDLDAEARADKGGLDARSS